MNREEKKQWMAIFLLLMFGGSTLAYAVMQVLPSETKEKLIFDEPLATSDEATFFQKNMVVVRAYYDQPSPTLDTLAGMINTLNSKMVLERININKNTELYTQMKDKFATAEMPMILIRGSTEIYLNGEQNETSLQEYICSVYFEPIDECAIV